jgi:hypothetical protein
LRIDLLFDSLLSSPISYGNTITFIDIDDTTFKTGSKVSVRNEDDVIIKRLSSEEYNHYKLKPGEHFDFTEFSDSNIFNKTAKPIPNVLRRVNQFLNVIKLKRNNDKIIFLTARTDMDNKELFLEAFRKIGIPVDDKNIVYIERAGNLIDMTTPQAKAHIIKKYLNTKIYSQARMLDDSIPNLSEFLRLQKEYPAVKFIAIKVTDSGNLKKIN